MPENDTPVAVIRARDLDTDDEVRTEVAAPGASTDDEVLHALTSIVGERFPAARRKSFANDVASFVDPKYLIIARYVAGQARPEVVRVAPPARAVTQTTLFSD